MSKRENRYLARQLCWVLTRAALSMADANAAAGIWRKLRAIAAEIGPGRKLVVLNPNASNAGAKLIHGICRQCGYTNQVPCDGVSPCVSPLKIAGGVCRICGGTGQIPCDAGCGSGLVVVNGLCASPQSPPPVTCASIGQACVPNTQPGTHCCQNPGAPESCVFGTCRACIPHGEEAPAFGTHICCAYQDSVVIDPFTGQWICDVPDGPDK